jgi:hypothetical protein
MKLVTFPSSAPREEASEAGTGGRAEEGGTAVGAGAAQDAGASVAQDA